MRFARHKMVRPFRAVDVGLTRIPIAALRRTEEKHSNKLHTKDASAPTSASGTGGVGDPEQLQLCRSQLTVQLAEALRARGKPDTVSEEQWASQVQQDITQRLQQLAENIRNGAVDNVRQALNSFSHSDLLCDPRKRGGSQLDPHGPWCFCIGGTQAWYRYVQLHTENDRSNINAADTDGA